MRKAGAAITTSAPSPPRSASVSVRPDSSTLQFARKRGTEGFQGGAGEDMTAIRVVRRQTLQMGWQGREATAAGARCCSLRPMASLLPLVMTMR